MLSEYTASAHAPLKAAWLLASSLMMAPNDSHRVANDLLQRNPMDTFVLVVLDFSALTDTADQFLVFRKPISLSFPDTTLPW